MLFGGVDVGAGDVRGSSLQHKESYDDDALDRKLIGVLSISTVELTIH